MSIVNTTRLKSIVTGSENLEKLAVFKSFPVFIGATEQPLNEDLATDMIWDICMDTGCIQLRQPIHPDLIYSGYHSEALGDTWMRHHQMLKDFTKDYVSEKIIEVGGSNGEFAKNLLEEHSQIESYTIVEPNPICQNNGKVDVINDFFGEKFSTRHRKKYTLGLHSHTLEHAYEPIDFIKAMSMSLEEGGYQVVSIPNLKKYIEKNFTNSLNFEHTYFLTRDLLIALMSQYSFELCDSYEFEEHSLFFAFKKNSMASKIALPRNYVEHKKLFLKYVQFHRKEVKRLNEIVSVSKKPVFLFGGHVFSQFLVNFGLDLTQIVKIIDNSKVKNGKRLYGTRLLIDYPEVIRNYKEPIIILKAGQYQKEIQKQLLDINPSSLILE